MIKLTHAETIARIERISARYDANSMLLRDLLMIDFEFPNDYEPPINDQTALDAELASITANYDASAESFPNAFKPLNDYERADLREMLDYLMTLDRQSISLMRLDDSLCPMHACDYAICFDDDDAECAAIRTCFPSHDT